MARLSSRQEKFASDAYRAAYAAGLRGVQADLAVAQAVHESAWGAKPSGVNNVHGIKGKTGSSVKTHEIVDGKRVNTKATFRDFESLTGSFRAWKGLMERKFSSVMSATNITDAIAGLKAGLQGGYATDDKYNAKVANIASLTSPFAVAAQLPDTMSLPSTTTRQQALDALATQATISQAYRDPFRALDVVPSRLPPLNPAPIGKVTRGPALPAPLPAAPAGLVTRASLPPPTRALPPSRPAALAAAPVGRVERAPLAPPTAPVGAITRGPTPAVAAAIADAYASPSRALDTLQPGLSSYTGMSTGKTPDQQAIADQVYAEQMATPPAPTLAEQLATASVAKTAPAPVLAPALAPPAPAAPALPPVAKPAPPLAPPVNIPHLPVAPVQALPPVAAPAQVSLGAFPSAPVSRPSLTPSDVYGGMAGQAISKSGNMVSGNGLGVTGVTNQFGATTGMKDGYQTALSGPLGITGPLDGQGIRTPGFLDGLGGKLTSPAMGQAVKTGAMGAIGGGVGGLLGPVGALLGGALGRELAKPGGGAIGGLLSGTRSFDTDFFGNVRTTAPQRGAFPGAPQGAPGALSGRQSNNSAEGMRGISPGAADAIGRGLGGLY